MFYLHGTFYEDRGGRAPKRSPVKFFKQGPQNFKGSLGLFAGNSFAAAHLNLAYNTIVKLAAINLSRREATNVNKN